MSAFVRATGLLEVECALQAQRERLAQAAEARGYRAPETRLSLNHYGWAVVVQAQGKEAFGFGASLYDGIQEALAFVAAWPREFTHEDVGRTLGVLP